MFKELFTIEYLEEIQYQVSKLVWDTSVKRITLNKSDSGLFTGKYTTLPQFQNTPLGVLLEELGEIGEARLLMLEAGDSYTAHTDPDDRIHLAITTNPYAYIIDLDDEKMYHLPTDGKVMLMDTSRKHLAGNYGGTSRIHLNVRAKLPNYTGGGYLVKIEGGDIDWKQQLYIDTMGYLNKANKAGLIRGIEKINERELLIDCSMRVLSDLEELVEARNFSFSFKKIL